MLSPDGDGGFPGNLRLRVTYTVTGRTLSVRYDAESDADTLFSPTCHIYFNLGGEDCGSAMDTRLRINAARYTPVGPDRIPTGELRAVDGTPFDFRTIKRIGRDIGADDDQLLLCGGYDHNYVLCSSHAATAECERTGATLDLYTDLPGIAAVYGERARRRRQNEGIPSARRVLPRTPVFPQCHQHARFCSAAAEKGRKNFLLHKIRIRRISEKPGEIPAFVMHIDICPRVFSCP